MSCQEERVYVHNPGHEKGHIINTILRLAEKKRRKKEKENQG